MERLRTLEKACSKTHPSNYIWAAYFTEVSPGLYAFEFPEHLRGKTASAKEIDCMHIPFVVCDFLNGKSKGWRS